MVAISAIAAAMASLRAIKDFAESAITFRDAETFQAKRLELESIVIDAQSSVFAANEERATLIVNPAADHPSFNPLPN